jgi:hypothetical protein
MNPETLIYSRDAGLSGALSAAVRRFKLEPVCVSRVGAALHQLRSRKFPAVIVDCIDRAAACDLFELCRSTGSNKSSVVFALTDETGSTSSWGVNFAVRRPVNLDLRAFNSVLRAAEGMIRQDFRRYRRIPIISVAVLDNEEHRLQVPMLNLSEGGMCVHSEIAGWKKEHIVQIEQPSTGLRVKANSYLVWTGSGKSGLQFRYMNAAARTSLLNWIDAH